MKKGNYILVFIIGLIFITDSIHANDSIKHKINCVFPQNDSTPQIGINCNDLYDRLGKSIGFDVISLSTYGSEIVVINERLTGIDSTRNLKIIMGKLYSYDFYKVIENAPRWIVPEKFKKGYEYEITYIIDVIMEYEMTLKIFWMIRKLEK